MVECLVIFQQILPIERQPVTQRGWFSGLEMGKRHQGGICPFLDQPAQSLQERCQGLQNQVEALAQPQSIRVILDVHRGCTQVDDPAANRALAGKDAHFSHQVMLDLSLDFEGAWQVDLSLVKAQIGSLFGRDKTVFRLDFGQGHP